MARCCTQPVASRFPRSLRRCRCAPTPALAAPTQQGWSRFTSGPFQLLEVEGHHLWPLEKASKAAWLGVIAEQLAALQL